MRTILIIIAIITISIAGVILVSMDEPSITSNKIEASIAPYIITPLPTYPCTTATPITNAIIPKDIATSNNEFAIKFYKQIADNENVFFSPTSIYTAFSAVYEGASGESAAQMQQVFGFEPDKNTRHNATAQMISSINRNDPYATLSLANAFWIELFFNLRAPYLDTICNVYLYNVELVNYENDGVEKINTWVADNTNDKIKEIIEPAYYGTLLITNAIYFKGTWLVEFPKENTNKSDFWKNSTDNVNIDFMGIHSDFDYTHSNGSQVLKIPYKGDRLSMLVILPDDLDGIESLEDMISAKQIDQWVDDLVYQRVDVVVPKFEMNTGYNLKDYLIELGMPNVFTYGSASLHSIGASYLGFLTLDAARQKAHVQVNEDGAKAVAVTGVAIDEPSFLANHPFIFLIYDDISGTILLMGKIVDPSLDS